MTTKHIDIAHEGVTVRLETASQRVYVTFAITAGGEPHIVKRTDSQDTAVKNHLAAQQRGFHRVVTVSFHGADPAHVLKRQVFVRFISTGSTAWLTEDCDTYAERARRARLAG